jgi:poly-gamma-glutamate capsule biosynthesis protein CapA/YwtB (metallophosphatase superfamily)
VLDEPDADHWLSGIASTLRAADLAIGHLEVPHTDCRGEVRGDVPAPGAPPGNLAAIARAGFGVVTLAGNHIADCGAQGIADTIGGLEAAGVAHCGAGLDLGQARRPVIREVNGLRVALLSYNCVGPEFAWATASSAGCAYLPLETQDGGPMTPLARVSRIAPDALAILEQDIAGAKEQADFVLVSMHKGRVHTPAILEAYERPLAQAAIDRGADGVIGHHAHIVRGIEFHRGKPIFHGLGNGCVVTRALSPAQDHPARREWAERRKALFDFEPDQGYELAPFHPQAKLAMLGKLTLTAGGMVEAAIVPVFVEPPGRPVLAEGARGDDVRRYVERITLDGGLPAIAIDESGRVSETA